MATPQYICEKAPLSEPRFSQDLLLPDDAALPYSSGLHGRGLFFI